ncbi:hypothetical protein [Bacteroides gallinarum]|uniref:hypothetical protein n=1 Tax=Bacteroides gallinarum TaxID=376806 RepID=UPI000362FF01|nr:hypothetical protein [Bacteroides gallinarum]
MNLKMNCRNLFRQLLPPHKRQPVRIGFLCVFASLLQKLFDSFTAWREDTRMMINVNSQVKVLESYLRKKYNEPVDIRIETFNNGLLLVGLESEGRTMWPEISLEDERQTRPVPLENEVRDKFEGVNFIVYIPEGIDRTLVEIDIEKFKQALITYKIIQQ